MPLVNGQVLQMIGDIAAALSTCERSTVLYLCGSLDIHSDSGVAGVKEMLKSQLIEFQRDQLFLVELVFALKRFDILRKVLGTSREEVEGVLGHRHLSRFRVLMSDLSEEMATEDLKSLTFLLSGTLPRDKIDQIKNFLGVAVELEKLDKVSPERVDFIEQCLRNIDRIDLAKKVSMYQRSVGRASQTQTAVPCQTIQQQRPATLSKSSPDEYMLHSDPTGLCLILDCVGSDGGMLEHTFKSLNFKVDLRTWLGVVPVDNMISALRGIFRRRENHYITSTFVCCIISRGTDTDLLGLRLDTVRRLFNAEGCPMLAGKPKLFFIQRYSLPEPQTMTAHSDTDLETDGGDCMSRGEVVPIDADMLWSHCWTDEVHLAQSDHHSVYLQALMNALQRGQCPSRSNIVDIHTEVNRVIYDHNRRNPEEIYHVDVKHTLRKNLYLP